MTTSLNPYLSILDGKAREAFEFYQSAFGGELKVTTFGESGMAGSPAADQVMHAQLTTATGDTLMGCDEVPGMMPPRTRGDSVQASFSSQGEEDGARGRDAYAKLSEGATVVVPLEKQMWGDEYAQLVDRYGIVWHFNIGA